MKYFSSAREAKEFLATRIIHEAALAGMTLSDIEQKMLYFTESGSMLPDIVEASDKFDQEYDQDEYELKIAKLVKGATSRAEKTSRDEYKQWWAAIRLLKKTEDDYISVLIERARLKPPGDLLKLWCAGLAVVGGLLLFSFVSDQYGSDFSRYFPNHNVLERFIWGTLGCVAALYVAARLLFGSRVDSLVFDLFFRTNARKIRQDKP